MDVNNWIDDNLIWITISIAGIVLLYFVFAIIQSIRKKHRLVSELTVILLILGLVFLIFLTYRASELEGADWGQVILMIGLVCVTAVYASSTKKQAEANEKMAEEMREQRYDSVRPIIDIAKPQSSDVSAIGEQTANNEELETHGFSCVLHNIGLGPAIDLYGFIQVLRETYIQERYDYGTLAKDGKTIPLRLSIKSENGKKYLTAYYKDVYGRGFESKRELIGETGNWKLGPLKNLPFSGDELP